MIFDLQELMSIENSLKEIFKNNLMEILTELNRFGKMEDFLNLIGKSELLGEKEETYKPGKNGLIIVLGETQIKENVMKGILNNFGICKDRLRCYLGYNEAKTFEYKKIKYQPKYSMVIVGAMGHKAKSIGNYSSAISMMEQEEGYPKIYRLCDKNGLKITKTKFKKAIMSALKEGIINKDFIEEGGCL